MHLSFTDEIFLNETEVITKFRLSCKLTISRKRLRFFFSKEISKSGESGFAERRMTECVVLEKDKTYYNKFLSNNSNIYTIFIENLYLT